MQQQGKLQGRILFISIALNIALLFSLVALIMSSRETSSVYTKASNVKTDRADQAGKDRVIKMLGSDVAVSEANPEEILRRWDDAITFLESGQAGSAGSPSFRVIPELDHIARYGFETKEVWPRVKRLKSHIAKIESDGNWTDSKSRKGIAEIEKTLQMMDSFNPSGADTSDAVWAAGEVRLTRIGGYYTIREEGGKPDKIYDFQEFMTKVIEIAPLTKWRMLKN